MSKRLIAYVLHILFYGLSVTSIAVADESNAPSAYCESTSLDLGTIVQGNHTHTFEIANTGNATLRLWPPRTSCGCKANTKLSKTLLEHGETSKLTSSLNLTKHKGNIKQTIWLQTNDSNNKLLKFSLQGIVKPVIETVPNKLFFGHIPQGMAIEKTFRVLSNTTNEIHATQVTCSSPYFLVIRKETNAGLHDEYVVRSSPDLPKGKTSATITILPDNKQFPTLTLPLFATRK